MRDDGSSPSADPVVGLLAILACPVSATREALYAEALERDHRAVLAASVDLVLSGFSDEGWLVGRVAEELGAEAPRLLLARARAAGVPEFPERAAGGIRHLFRLADSPTARAYVRGLDAPDPGTAFVAICAAGTISLERASLAPLLTDLGIPLPMAALGRIATRPEPFLRRAAAQALALMPPAEAIPILEILAADAEPAVRAACYWAVRVLSLTDAEASRLLAVAFHVEDDPDLRELLDGLLSSAPIPETLLSEIVGSIGRLEAASDRRLVGILAQRIEEISGPLLDDLQDLACILLLVSRIAGVQNFADRTFPLIALLRRMPADGSDELSALQRYGAFVTASFLTIVRAGLHDPLILEGEISQGLAALGDTSFLPGGAQELLMELTQREIPPAHLEELALALGKADRDLAGRLALLAFVGTDEPVPASKRPSTEDSSSLPLHLRLRRISAEPDPHRACFLILSSRTHLPGLPGLSALLALARAGDVRSLVQLRPRLLQYAEKIPEALMFGSALVLPPGERQALFEGLRQARRGPFASLLETALANPALSGRNNA